MNNKVDKKEWQSHKNPVMPVFNQWQDWNTKLGGNPASHQKQNKISLDDDHFVNIYKAHNESNSERFSSDKPSKYIEYNWEITKTDN